MFSYLHGMRPNARRTTSSQVHSSHQPIILNSPQRGPEYTSRYYSNASSPSSLAFDAGQTSSVPSVPPSLPPIPRVASQYGPPEQQDFRLSDDRPDDRDHTRFQGPEAFKLYKASQQGAKGLTLAKIDAQTSSEGVPETSHRFTQFYHTPQHQELSTEHAEHLGGRSQPRRLYTEPGPDRPVLDTESELINTQHDASRYQSYQAQHAMSTMPAHARPIKPKLNRLNPMSILSRKRTAQTATQLIDNASLPVKPSSRSSLPDDYDPRIRGKVVHDFNAPRPARPKTSNDVATTDIRAKQYPNIPFQDNGKGVVQFAANGRLAPRVSTQGYSSDSQSSPERQHTPCFKENFGEELEPWRFDSSDRRNQLTTGLLERMPIIEGGTSTLPPFARNFPPDPKTIVHSPAVEEYKITPQEPQLLSSIQSTPSPPKSRSRATSITDPLFQSAGLPKHLKSTASRFSFDLGGVGSAAQEKLLEDKHRQKNARRERERVSGTSNMGSSTGRAGEDEDFTYDNMDFDDDLEEKIPGVNADADEEPSFDCDGGYHTPNIGSTADADSAADAINPGFYLQESNNGFTSRLHNRGSEGSLASQQQLNHVRHQAVEDIHDSTSRNEPHINTQAFHERLASNPPTNPYEDDLYFDDGLIDDFEETESRSFDESVFDDETSRVYGLPLRDLNPLPILAESSTAETSQQSTRPMSTENAQVQYHAHPEEKEDADRRSMPPPAALPVRKSSLVSKGEVSVSNFGQSAGLTRDNLQAYHSALALAADRAAREGRFDRKPSIDDGAPQQQSSEGRKLRVSFDEHQANQSFEALPAVDNENEPESFDFDDGLDDDAIIAAANAEALENDEEGFYGQEFGFFAHTNGTGEAEYANGGYFGPAGHDGVKRSHSGKANFQEPSLTPITERSEWSQRNSMISLAMQGGAFPPAQQTPGLAQLADAMQYEDDSMSLSALLKLRRGAFGGSNGSLQSLGSQRSGSPQRYNAQASAGMLNNGIRGSQLAGGSTFSLVSSNDVASDDEQPPGSPTLTLQTQGLIFSPPGLPGDRSSGSDSSPKRRGAVRGFGHSRNSSGAESICYVTETDEDGAKRWVLEKRRMAEGGQMEIMDRHFVGRV